LQNDNKIKIKEIQENNKNKQNSIDNNLFINLIDSIIFQKWYVQVTLIINAEFQITTVTLLDLDANMNCIQEWIILTKYYEKKTEKLYQASGTRLNIEYKIPNAYICNDGICFKTTFILVKNITSKIILENPFLTLLDPFIKTEENISTEIMGKKILFKFILPLMTKDINMWKNISIFQEINVISKQIKNRENHVVQLPYESNFNEKTILTKAKFIQMNQEL
jgi:hypothetical protein